MKRRCSSLAASLERASEHPLAAAIVAAAKERGLVLQDTADFKSLTGKGVTGTIWGRRVAVGNAALLERSRRSPSRALDGRAEELRRDGATAMFVGVDRDLAGDRSLSPIRSSRRHAAALAALRAEGIRIVMLTGDNRTTAQAVAGKLGIAEIEAEVPPERQTCASCSACAAKAASSRWPATASTTPLPLPPPMSASPWAPAPTSRCKAPASRWSKAISPASSRARHLSRATMRNIRQNLALAFVYNTLGIPLAAGVLYPAFGLLLSPIVAAAAMSLSSVSVISNALRLRLTRL